MSKIKKVYERGDSKKHYVLIHEDHFDQADEDKEETTHLRCFVVDWHESDYCSHFTPQEKKDLGRGVVMVS